MWSAILPRSNTTDLNIWIEYRGLVSASPDPDGIEFEDYEAVGKLESYRAQQHGSLLNLSFLITVRYDITKMLGV